jgi:hypothetical protein
MQCRSELLELEETSGPQILCCNQLHKHSQITAISFQELPSTLIYKINSTQYQSDIKAQ